MAVLIYDSDCNMCSSFIQFIVRKNQNQALRITDFDSEWTRENRYRDKTDSIIYIDSSRNKFYYSGAIIRLLSDLRLTYKLFKLLLIIPRPIRDTVYRYISKRRKKISENFNCPLPSKEFLDMYLE